MEKLIELLNECKPLNKWVHYEYNNWLFIMYDWSGREIWTSIEDEILISKKFWFIKRLVENDKIDRPKVWLKIKDLWDDYWWFAIYSWIHIECLLMLLSIQDKPIDFLISILE